jgi:hypothetical protein
MGVRLDKQCHVSNSVSSIITKRFVPERILTLQKLIPSNQKLLLFIRLACAPFSNMKLGGKKAKGLKSTYQFQKLQFEMTANKSEASKAGIMGVTGTNSWSRLKLSIA